MTSLASNFPSALMQRLLLQPWLPRLINVLLVIFLLWLAYSYAEQFIYPQPDTQTPVVNTTPASQAPESKIDLATIPNWHLFGIADLKENAASAEIINAPETKLKLTLRGIAAETDKHKGFAIIQKPDQKEQHFSINDSIFGLATLEEIYVDRVIIMRKGQYETLTLPKEALLFDILSDKIKKAAEMKTMSTWRKSFVERNVLEYSEWFGFDPIFRGGGFHGFTVKSMSEEGTQMLATLGLEDGDVITAVNGKRFAEDINATADLKQLKTATEVDVEIERGGVPLFLHLTFDESILPKEPTPFSAKPYIEAEEAAEAAEKAAAEKEANE